MAPDQKTQPHEEHKYTFEAQLSDGRRFVFRDRTLRQEIRERHVFSEIWGTDPTTTSPADAIFFEIALDLATMKATCIESPEGWNWDALANDATFMELRMRFHAARNDFRNGVVADKAPTGQEDSAES